MSTLFVQINLAVSNAHANRDTGVMENSVMVKCKSLTKITTLTRTTNGKQK